MDVGFDDDDDFPEFFKVYITIHSSNQMVIPREFVEYMGRTKSGLAELIHGRSKETWRVELVHDGTDFCFTVGWQDFVEANMIQDGNFIFFKFYGDMKFGVIVYDESMCEKEIGKCLRHERNATQESKEKTNVVNVKQEDDLSLAAENPSSPSEVKSKTAKRKVQVQPFFEKRITECSVNLSFPMAFVKENSLIYKSNEKMILRTSRSASWEINIINNRGIIVMSAGWIAFVRENSIKVGDICKFQLIDRLEMMVRVTRTCISKKGEGKKR